LSLIRKACPELPAGLRGPRHGCWHFSDSGVGFFGEEQTSNSPYSMRVAPGLAAKKRNLTRF